MAVRNLAATRPARLPLASAPAPWVRNPSWLPLPVVGNTEQAFRGLLAVFPDSSFTALTAAADYVVDWGDGTSNTYAGGATALKQYNFNAAALVGTDAPVTLIDAGDLVQRNGHGYANGQEVRFFNITTTTGLAAGQVYFVVNATANTFQVAATVGGAPIALTNDGSATLLPYRQAIVTVTPQSGQNLTALNLHVRHTQTGLQAYETGWLDIEVGSPNFSAAGLVIAGDSSSLTVLLQMCERVAVRNFGGVTDLSFRFRLMRALRAVILADTSAVTTTNSMFLGCANLQSVPYFNTASVTNMGFMFQTCIRLQTVPLLNTSSVTNMVGMFQICSSLETVPLFDTSAVTNMSSMFASCVSLKNVPLFNTAAVTIMTAMFQSCSLLERVPLFNTAAVTSMSQMFSGCSSLQSVPRFNTAAVTNMSLMFQNCALLESVPLFNTAAVTNMSQMFNTCPRLQTLPLFNTASVTNMSSMFSNCSRLQAVPALVTNAVTSGNFSLIFNACASLARIEAKDFRFSFSVANCKLSAAALDEIYTNLPTVTGQTITVTGNWGTAGDNTSIATAKGWTVTG